MDIKIFQHLMSKSGDISIIYKAMEHEDLAQVTITTLNLISKYDLVAKIEQVTKSERASNLLRQAGNVAYKSHLIADALLSYTKAIVVAPVNSLAMKLAYSNRSAAHFTGKSYRLCLKDIETCLSMGCTGALRERLLKRKGACEKLYTHNDQDPILQLAKEHFNFNVAKHPCIPCASDHVEVAIKSQLPKIVAAKNIKVGEVIAIETPFVSLVNEGNSYHVCHYCHNISTSLIPCENCCFTLYCDENCRRKSMNEIHSVECKLMEYIQCAKIYNHDIALSLIASLKVKLMCKSWREFINESYNIGFNRMKNSSVNEIFDSKNFASMLNFVERREIKYGAMFNFAVPCAVFIHNLSSVPSFLPSCPEDKELAIQAIARVAMHLYLTFHSTTHLHNIFELAPLELMLPNYGWYSFTSKLNHSCDPNLITIALNNKVALVAHKPIKKGSELTISFIGDTFLQKSIYSGHLTLKQRTLELYEFSIYCDCTLCDKMSDIQGERSVVEEAELLYLLERLITCANERETFKKMCTTLTTLHGSSNPQYHSTYSGFRHILLMYQFVLSRQKHFL